MPTTNRNRQIYQSDAVFCGPSPATGQQFYRQAQNTGFAVRQLTRVQSATYGYNIPKTDINQFGELANIDRVNLVSPTATLDITYISQSMINETYLGFTVKSGGGSDSSAITDILDGDTDEKNYFIKTSPEGVDSLGDTTYGGNVGIVSIGNGFITNYTATASVGNFPTCSISVEGLNMDFQLPLGQGTPTGTINANFLPTGGIVIDNPAVLPSDGSPVTGVVPIPTFETNPNAATAGTLTLSALRPGDITVNVYDNGTTTTVNEGGPSIGDWKIQSYNISIPMSREPLNKLGTKFAFARTISFPITITCSIDGQIGAMQTGSVENLISGDRKFDIDIAIKHPTGGYQVNRYTIKKCTLDSQNYSSSIGANKTCTLNFSSQLGGPGQTGIGAFFSGRLT